MNCKQREELIQDLSLSNICYLKAKNERVMAENQLNMSDWNKINDARELEDLPKLTNQKARDAYVNDQVNEFRVIEIKRLCEFNRLQRIYENREFLEYKRVKEEVKNL